MQFLEVGLRSLPESPRSSSSERLRPDICFGCGPPVWNRLRRSPPRRIAFSTERWRAASGISMYLHISACEATTSSRWSLTIAGVKIQECESSECLPLPPGFEELGQVLTEPDDPVHSSSVSWETSVISLTPCLDEISGFLNHRAERPAAERAPDFWNDAEGAGVIAPLRDLHVGGVAGRAQCARALCDRTGRGRHRCGRRKSAGSTGSPATALQISLIWLVPRMASTSTKSAAISRGYRSARHPVTTRRWQRPVFLSSAISRIVSMDSFLDASMKLQVLTTMTSASDLSGQSVAGLLKQCRASLRCPRGFWGIPG